MKLKLAAIILLLPFLVLSQTQTIKLDKIAFLKINTGYLVFGNSEDNFTLTKYDNQLAKVKEYSKSTKDIKFKSPSVKKFPNYIQLVFVTKLFPLKGIVMKLDTNLNLLEERKFDAPDYENSRKQGISLDGDKFYPSLSFEDDRTLSSHYTYYDDKIAVFDFKNKRIVFGKHNNSSPVTYYDKINSADVLCEGTIESGGYGFTHLNGRLFFYIKTKTDEISTKMNALGARRSASLGELIVGEIDIKENKIKYVTRISNLNTDYDFLLDKLFYDSSVDKLLVAGTYLENETFENSKAKEGSQWTGWYTAVIDSAGKLGPSSLVKNDSRDFVNIKEKTQNNRRTTIKSIEKNGNGYVIIAELESKFFRTYVYEELNTKTTTTSTLFQPLGFCRFALSKDMTLKHSEFYPAKRWHKIKFEEVEDANLVRSGECRSEAYCISGSHQSSVVYSYGKHIILCNAGGNYALVQELLSVDVEDLFRKDEIPLNLKNVPNTTWFYPFDDKNYYLVQWKPKEIVFNLLPY